MSGERRLEEAIEVRCHDHAHVSRFDEACGRSMGGGRGLEALFALLVRRLEVCAEETVAFGRFRGELREQRRVAWVGAVTLTEPSGLIASRVLAVQMRDAVDQIGHDLPAGGKRPRRARRLSRAEARRRQG
jgi:hypothetical protein